MKAKRWEKEKGVSDINIVLLALSCKLNEEASEVTKEITKAPFRKNGLNKKALLKEIDHVETMAKILRAKVERYV